MEGVGAGLARGEEAQLGQRPPHDLLLQHPQLQARRGSSEPGTGLRQRQDNGLRQRQDTQTRKKKPGNRKWSKQPSSGSHWSNISGPPAVCVGGGGGARITPWWACPPPPLTSRGKRG